MSWPEIVGGLIGGIVIGLAGAPLKQRIAEKLRGVKPPPKPRPR